MKDRSPTRYLFTIAIIILAVISVWGCSEHEWLPITVEPPPDVEPDPPSDTLKVLFIGNSLTHYFDLPGMFREMAEAAGKTVLVERMVIGGTSLSDFCSMPECTEKINSDRWHYVSLQGTGPGLVYPELYTDSERGGLDCLILRMGLNCPESIPVYFMGFGWLDGTAWMPGYSDTYEELAQKIIDETLEMAEERDLMVAPIGAVWKNVHAHKPELDLFDPDMSHPALAGTYLNACVFYCCLFQESISGNSYLGGLPQADAEYLQLAASTELLFNGHLYNITPPDSTPCPPVE